MDEIFNFIDESGDAEFFGKRGKQLWTEIGWNPLLIMGLVQTIDRKSLRKDILEVHQQILTDPLYSGIHSLEKENHFFHASVDHAEIRAAFFQFLRKRKDFKCYLVINIKNPEQFITHFEKNTTKFYFHCVKQLLELIDFDKKKKHIFYLSRRNKTTNDRFDKVIKEILSIEMVEEKLEYLAEVVKSSDYPELCVIDYTLWAVQRFILKGEKRFLNALEAV